MKTTFSFFTSRYALNAVPIGRSITAVIAAFCASVASAQPAQKPLTITSVAPPAVLLTMGRDHKLFYEAYNDASDVDGDGIIDSTYKPQPVLDGSGRVVVPGINYFGLFDSFKCYQYDATNQYFTPVSFTANKKCSGDWSGDFLNYLTTTRIDAVRKVLYGGARVVDTATETVVERAYIPQDAHSFGKEWRNDTTNPTLAGGSPLRYALSDYAPAWVIPAVGRQVFFTSVTPLASSSRADLAQRPLLRVLIPPRATDRLWDWLSKERPVAGNRLFDGTTVTPVDLVVRVKVCVSGLLEPECQGYPAASPTTYKPIGILHEFGEDSQMYFGLLTGSYDNNNDGGVLRKNISSFAEELNLSDGTFKPSVQGIVHNLNRLRVESFGGSYSYDCGWNVGNPSTSGQNCSDWGNPVAEMMYEGLRYFAGKSTPTPAYVTAGAAKDSALGLTRPAWVDPFRSSSNPGGLPYCSKPVQMVISDIYASFDSDKVPGTSFGSFSGDLGSLSVSAIGDTLSAKEGISGGRYFIGQSGSTFDKIPSAKTVAGFGSIRGLAPEEPTRAGSYYAASVAHFGKGTDLRTDLADGGWAQTVDTYSIALASPLPKIQIPVGSGASTRFVTLIPFAKSVSGYGISPATTAYQPSNQIVDFYIETIVNQPGFPDAPTVNGGRPYGKFRINFEDVEQGADHDMDAIAQYEYELLADGRIRISVDSSRYASGGIVQHMGYVLDGTTKDGTYLVVRDSDTTVAGDANYYLDSKPSDGSYDSTNGLPLVSVEYYTPGPSSDAKFIPKDPLWYAAKYGGYPDKKDPSTKKVLATGVTGALEPGWDSRTTGEPNNYYLVTNAGTLRDELRRAFLEIRARLARGTAAATGTTTLSAKSRAYEAEYNAEDWTGEVRGYRVAKDGLRSALWATSDTGSFPADKSLRRIVTSWNSAAYEFKTSGPGALPSAAAPIFALSNLYSLLETDPSLSWSTKTPSEKRTTAFEILTDYIRGDKSKEQSAGGPLRNRTRLLGDIVNSNVVLASDTDFGFSGLPGSEGTSYDAYVNDKAASSLYKTVYVGGNDGMLHAFDAETGIERFAYVPSSVYSRLYKLAVPGYQHEYYVDGRLVLSDAYRGSGWTTVLLGSTGAGGRSVFALDVGSPTGSTSNVLWEFSDPDLGYPIGVPAIARTSGAAGRWVAIFANGYFGDGRKASLFVLDLFTGAKLAQLDLETATGANGLGSIGVHKRRNVVNQIYAGDLQGNFWKINASDPDPSSWTIANSGLPLIQAKSPDGTVQPITAQPTIATLGTGTQVYFGTGKLFEAADRSNVDVQSVYGLWLPSDPGRTLTRADLNPISIAVQTDNFRGLSAATPTGDERGWVLDLVAPGGGAPTGERVVSTLHYSFGEVDFNTWYLGDFRACEPGGESWLMSLAGSGNVNRPLFDTNGDDRVNTADTVGGKAASGLKLGNGTVADPSVNFTPGDPTNSASKGAKDASGAVTTTPRTPGSCPPCHKILEGNICRPQNACSPDSWIQLQ